MQRGALQRFAAPCSRAFAGFCPRCRKATSIRRGSTTTTIAWRRQRDAERDKLHAVIKQQFQLDEATTDELVVEATAAENEAVDLYHFTSLINRSLDEEGRSRVVEMMWEIAYADGQVDDFESNLIWRAADLLGISSRERIELGHRVASRRGTAPT
jgi:uncharacterized tellurite resistance protein B-like protein